MSRILIVEDEQHLAAGLRFNLEAEGYRVETTETGEAALAILAAPAPAFDLVVLDVMLPGINGFSVIANMRQAGQFVPTLMLTARGQPEDVLKGFAAGADDYLSKPFELPILLARIQSLLRRKEWLKTGPAPAAPSAELADTFHFEDKSVNFSILELRVGPRVFPLTLMEANLLKYLIQHEGETVSRKRMLEEVWGLNENTDTRPIDNFIVRLRRYMDENSASPRHLITVRGIGYRFIAHPPPIG